MRVAKNNRRCAKAGFGGLDEVEGWACQNEGLIIFKAFLVSFFLPKKNEIGLQGRSPKQRKGSLRVQGKNESRVIGVATPNEQNTYNILFENP